MKVDQQNQVPAQKPKSAVPVIIGLIILGLLLVWLLGGGYFRNGGGELNSTVPVQY
jgi:hypothetical protein